MSPAFTMTPGVGTTLLMAETVTARLFARSFVFIPLVSMSRVRVSVIFAIIRSVSLEFVLLRHWTKLVDAYTPSGMKSTNVTRVSHLVSQQDRCLRQGHLGGVLWFTGLPASGKKTIAFQLERRLFEAGYEVFAFDSTWQRKGLSSDLGFSREDRRENIRRAGELAAIMARSGIIAISAFVSPYSGDRAAARATVGENFHEIFMNVPLDVCMARDTQDRYVRASHGEFVDFTGVTAPYEGPCRPEVTLGVEQSVDESIDRLTDYVNANFRNI